MKKLIDKVDWMGLSCHDRALALGCEDIKTNSALYFLLFKYAGRDYLLRDYYFDIGDDDYYRYIGKMMGIDIELKVDKKVNLHRILTTKYQDDEKIVVVTNSINEPETRMYKRENHPHFILLQNYQKDKESVTVIDEDYSKRYWEAKISKQGVKYIKKEMPIVELINRCNDVNCFSKFRTDENICAYYHLKKSNPKENTLDDIFRLFYQELGEYIKLIDSVKEKSIIEFNKFTQRIKHVKNEIIYDIKEKFPYDIKEESGCFEEEIWLFKEFGSWFAYPYEAKIVAAHHYFIYSVYMVFQALDKAVLEKNKMILELLKRHEELKINITRAVISGEKKICSWCIKEFDELIDLEYRMIVEWYKNRRKDVNNG